MEYAAWPLLMKRDACPVVSDSTALCNIRPLSGYQACFFRLPQMLTVRRRRGGLDAFSSAFARVYSNPPVKYVKSLVPHSPS
jgi:hypothetical protein